MFIASTPDLKEIKAQCNASNQLSKQQMFPFILTAFEVIVK